MSTQPSDTLVRDLQIEIRRLAKMTTVLSLGLQSGTPLVILDTMIIPVESAATRTRSLIAQAVAADVSLGDLRIQIDQPLSPELESILADLVDGAPDDIGGLL